MSNSILREVGGFTPVIDIVAEDVGFVTAAVYGVHWRYCQMEEGVSRAAMQRIAAHLGVSVKTARRHTQKLREHGYLEDLTPGLAHAPHTYRDNGSGVIDSLLKARMYRESDLAAGRVVSESNPAGQSVQPGGTEGPGGSDSESTKDSRKKEEKENGNRRCSHLWGTIQAVLRGTMTSDMFQAHYEKARPLALEGDVLTVAMPSPGSLAATQRLNRRVADAVEKQCDVRLVFVAEGCCAGILGQGSG